MAEVHRAAVERADLGLGSTDVLDAVGRTTHVRTVVGGRQRLLDAAEHEVATHARREIDDDVGVRGPDPFDDLFVLLNLAGRHAVVLTHVDMHDRRTRLGRLDAAVGDLLGRHGHLVGLVRRVSTAGHRAGDEDAVVCGHVRFPQEADLLMMCA